MSKNNLRSRQWFLMTYSSPDEFKPLLDVCLHYAYIFHDKEDSEPHYHIACVFKNARALSGLISLINSTQNTFGEVVKVSLTAVFDYLTHKNDENKFQYSEELIVFDDLSFWKNCTDDVNTTDSLIDDILSGLPLRSLAHRYGRDFMKNWRCYVDFARNVAWQENGFKFKYECIVDDVEFENEYKKFKQGVYSVEQLEVINHISDKPAK